MFNYILRKFLYILPTFFGITFFAFSFIRLLPGDPVLLLAGERGITAERHAELLKKFGFDKPLYQQYFSYLTDLFQFDFGTSINTKKPVLEEFFSLFPATLELAFFAMIIATFLGVFLGIFSAIKKGTTWDHSIMGISLVGYSMPIFWWALLMIILFSGILGWTPVSGRISFLYFFDNVTGFMLIDSLLSGQRGAFLSAFRHIILPAIVLSTIPLAIIARQTRSAMIEVLNEHYILVARAKGLSKIRVIGIHAFRNAMITIITVIGLQVGVLLAGVILTESIFSWPGIGKWIVHAVFRRDYPVVQGGLIIIAMIIMCVNLLVDVTYALINPKIRYTEHN